MENEVSGRNPLADLVNLQVKPLSFLPWKHSSSCNWVTTMVTHCYPILSRKMEGDQDITQILLVALSKVRRNVFPQTTATMPNSFSFFSS